MSLTTIEETVQRAAGSVPHGYQNKVSDVVAAVTEREYVLAERAVDAATSQGLGTDQARGIVENIGLTLRPAPEPVAASNGASDDTPVGEQVENLLTGMRNLFDDLLGRVRN